MNILRQEGAASTRPLDEKNESRRKVFYSIKAKFDADRTVSEKLADFMTLNCGGTKFLIFNVFVFFAWIVVNTGLVGWIPVFDPYPFVLLTTAVSIEAIILAIFVLISQNRSLKLDDLRAEIDLKINLISEQENTKMMEMLALLLNKNGVDLSKDPDLKRFLKPVNEEQIESKLKKEIF